MRRSLIGAFALVSILVLGCESTSRVDAINRMNEGILQLNKGNISGAQKAMEESIKLDPTFAEAHLNLGKLHRKQEHFVDAEKAFEAAIGAEPSNPNGETHLELALVQIAQVEEPGIPKTERDAKYREAITALQSAIAADPTLYKAHYQLGYLHEKLDEPAPADTAYRDCITANARYTPAFVALGNMYIDYGFSNVAMAVLETGTQVNETDAAMWNGMGRALLNLNRGKESVDAYLKARAIDPDMPDVLYGLGMAYADLRMKDESTEALEAFLKKAGDSPEHIQKAARDTLARMQDVI